jgi:hypothetical protein
MQMGYVIAVPLVHTDLRRETPEQGAISAANAV